MSKSPVENRNYLRESSARVCSPRWSKLESNFNGCRHRWHAKLTFVFKSTISCTSLIKESCSVQPVRTRRYLRIPTNTRLLLSTALRSADGALSSNHQLALSYQRRVGTCISSVSLIMHSIIALIYYTKIIIYERKSMDDVYSIFF